MAANSSPLIYYYRMLTPTLSRLRCPSFIHESTHCGGKLEIREIDKEKSGDILFGTLACTECDATYPILAGIAILVNDVEQYLQLHVKGVSSLVLDSEIPAPYREAYLLAKEAIDTGFTEDDLESRWVNSLYYMSHYLSVAENRKKPWWRPKGAAFSADIDRLMKSSWDKGPFAKIGEWCEKLKSQNVIELGCGVGGLALALERSLRSYLGVDSSFAGIALARHIHLQAPYSGPVRIPQDLYLGPVSGKPPARKSKKTEKVDFIVGELERLPVANHQFDLALALNTIDMIEEPAHLPRLQFALLKEKGLAIQSSPYIWHEAVSETLRKILPKRIRSSSEAVEFLYERAGFRIAKTIEHLPWLFLKHFRQLEVYSVHLFAAEKALKNE